MSPDLEKLDALLAELMPFQATLVAVSKTKPEEAISLVYNHGQRIFGENYVQELVSKQASLPADIMWHFIGHLQSNKVKQIAPFVNLIHGIDSKQLASEVSKQAVKFQRNVDVLLQVYIASEETKFGFSAEEVLPLAIELINNPLQGLTIRGLMGMASFTENESLISSEFKSLKRVYNSISENINAVSFNILSMGMSSDYKIALNEGSNMVRIGSAIFGGRS